MSLEFLQANFLNTTTMLALDSSTDRASYLFDRDTRFQYVSNGYGGSTSTTIRINFSATTTVSRIALLGHNLKDFRIYYNGVTASTFTISNGDTASTNYTSNSETSQYFRVSPVDCTSVSIQMNSTIVAGNEKAIGFLVISHPHTTLSRPPSAKNYKPQRDPTDVTHILSDGGTRVQNIADKWTANIKYQHISASERSALEAVWSLHDEFIFCPFGTTTGWDGILFPCVWTGNFSFYEYSDNAVSAGFSGVIALKETPR